jgi:hypothetical protein
LLAHSSIHLAAKRRQQGIVLIIGIEQTGDIRTAHLPGKQQKKPRLT